MSKIRAVHATRQIALALATCLTIALTGCAQTGTNQAGDSVPDLPTLPSSEEVGEGGGAGSSLCVSRPYFYDSEEALAADCDTILIGTVLMQDDAYDTDPYIPDTRARVQVIDGKKGNAVADEEVIIRQTGDLSLSILEDGATYLFYLNDCPSSNTGPKQYYITGVTAGAFKLNASPESSMQRVRRNSQDVQFCRVDNHSGDQLPDTLSLDEITAESD